MLAADYREHVVLRGMLSNSAKSLPSTFDVALLQDLYHQISTIIGGEEQLEWLSFLIRQRFPLVISMVGFMQGMIDDLLHYFVYQHPEKRIMKKTVFLFWR